MDDLRFGSLVRTARIRRGWRQKDLAAAAGGSISLVSRIERGHIGNVALATVRAICAALEIRLELLPRSRLADSDRLLNARHAALSDHVVRWLSRLPGWVVRPEVSFSRYGERGVVDLLAWHPVFRALLVIELKTEIVDVGEVLGTLDRKRRLAREIAAELGWDPLIVGVCLIVGDSVFNRRRVADHHATFRAALPQDGRGFRGWLRAPAGDLRALFFVANSHPGQIRSAFAAPRRVRRRSPRSN